MIPYSGVSLSSLFFSFSLLPSLHFFFFKKKSVLVLADHARVPRIESPDPFNTGVDTMNFDFLAHPPPGQPPQQQFYF